MLNSLSSLTGTSYFRAVSKPKPNPKSDPSADKDNAGNPKIGDSGTRTNEPTVRERDVKGAPPADDR